MNVNRIYCMVICIQQVLMLLELLEPGVRNCISKGPVTFSCLLSMQCQSSLQLILAYILPWLAFCISIFLLLPLCPLCWMVVLSIVLQYVTPKSFCFFFLSWFFNQYLFFTKVSEQLLSIVCKHLVLPVVFTSFFISPDSFIWAFSFNFPFEGFSYC